MFRLNTPALIEPPINGANARPYAAIWPRIITLVSIASAIAGILSFLRLLSPALLTLPYANIVTVILSLLPIAIWGGLSIQQERSVSQPRVALLSIGFTALLTTYTLVLPFVDSIFTINQWLPLASAVDRILGGLRRFHLHEAEALGATSGTVGDHSGGNYWTSLCKERTQIFVSRGIAQIANIQFLSHKILSIA